MRTRLLITATTLPALTLAYSTTVTNPGNFSSTSQYDYDLGTNRKIQDPKGAFRTTTYDTSGRISRTDISNGAYKRFVYSTDSVTVSTFALMQAGGGEFFSSRHADGAGRMVMASSDFPNSTGRYRHQFTIYDNMGRMSQQSNPTETDNQGTPAGDDEAGFAYTTQTYDWKGRPLITTYVNNTRKEISYGGCGCAGGEVATTTDEEDRQQRMTYDMLGRVVKTEELNFNGSVYRTTTNLYNARDQVTRMRMFQGTDASTTFQDTVMTYDGHGRLSTRKTPIESANCVYS